ncbi:MAG: hypothetical protein LBK27_00855 [Treponema sp.]|nr:hypothetical protein [Treponema sp.]
MQKAGAFLLFLCLLLAQGPFGFAQEKEPGIEEEVPVEPDWDMYIPSLYSRGDKTVSISLGLIFPLALVNQGKTLSMQMIPIGGTGNIMFNYFLDSRFFLGGEAGLMFIGTQRKNTFLAYPFGFRGGYQFILGRFEFPLALSIGFAPQHYLDEKYFGMYIKPAVSAFFRLTPDWSFGATTQGWWIPQWPKEKDKAVDGYFIDVTLSARFHF